jgi:hypothetical protein
MVFGFDLKGCVAEVVFGLENVSGPVEHWVWSGGVRRHEMDSGHVHLRGERTSSQTELSRIIELGALKADGRSGNGTRAVRS